MNKPGLAAAWLGNSHSPKEKPRIFTPEDPGLLFHPVQSNHRGACRSSTAWPATPQGLAPGRPFLTVRIQATSL